MADEMYSLLNPSGTTQAQPQGPSVGSVLQPRDPLEAEITRPAASQEEVQDRFVKFKQMFADPKFQQALLMFGSQMLKQGGQGDNTMQAFGGATQVGLGTYNLLQQQEQQANTVDAETARRAQATQAQVGAQEAQTAESRYRTGELQRTQSDRDKARMLEISKMEKSIAGLDLDIAGGKTRNELNAIKLMLEQKYGEERQIATLDDARAAARIRSLKAKVAEIEANAAGNLSPDEQKQMLLGRTGAGARSAAVEADLHLESLVKRAIPGIKDQELANMVLALKANRKEGVVDELKIIDAMQYSGNAKLQKEAEERLIALSKARGARGSAMPQSSTNSNPGTGRGLDRSASPPAEGKKDPPLGSRREISSGTWEWMGRPEGWRLIKGK